MANFEPGQDSNLDKQIQSLCVRFFTIIGSQQELHASLFGK